MTTVAYRDTFSYRKGREQSKVVQTWLSSHKSNFLHMVKTEKSKNGLKYNLDDIILGSSYTAHIVVNQLRYWLTTDSGFAFVEEAFDVRISDRDVISLRGRMAEYWMEEISNFMANVIYRYDDTLLHNPPIPKDILHAIQEGSPETAEIVADTFIGWLNSLSGREFVEKVFKVPIPASALDGSD